MRQKSIWWYRVEYASLTVFGAIVSVYLSAKFITMYNKRKKKQRVKTFWIWVNRTENIVKQTCCRTRDGVKQWVWKQEKHLAPTVVGKKLIGGHRVMFAYFYLRVQTFKTYFYTYKRCMCWRWGLMPTYLTALISTCNIFLCWRYALPECRSFSRSNNFFARLLDCCDMTEVKIRVVF